MFIPGPVTEVFFRRTATVRVTISCLVVMKLDRTFVYMRLVAIKTLSKLKGARLYDIVSVVFAKTEVPLTVLLYEATLKLGKV